MEISGNPRRAVGAISDFAVKCMGGCVAFQGPQANFAVTALFGEFFAVCGQGFTYALAGEKLVNEDA